MTHPCVILVKYFDKNVHLVTTGQVQKLDKHVQNLASNDAPLRHEL